MIMIYSADAATGRLYTDPKQRAYIDAELLQEKATLTRTAAVLDRISVLLGFLSFEALDTYARCNGITKDVLMSWILSGEIAAVLHRLSQSAEDIEKCHQWVADVYHCSDCWGQTMTEEDMRETLIEHQKEKFPDEYSPDPAMAAECAAYWNELCAMYPN